jgi:hypothetical protein
VPVLEAELKNNFHTIVTGDESWFYLDSYHQTQWTLGLDDVLAQPSRKMSDKKLC